MFLNRLRSSKNIKRLTPLHIQERSSMKILNGRGPKCQPCRTPDKISTVTDLKFLYLTICVLLFRYYWTNLMVIQKFQMMSIFKPVFLGWIKGFAELNIDGVTQICYLMNSICVDSNLPNSPLYFFTAWICAVYLKERKDRCYLLLSFKKLT